MQLSSVLDIPRSTMMPLEIRVFLYLHTSKFQDKFSTEWRASSDAVLNQVLGWLNECENNFNMSMDQLKQIVTDLEEKVRRYKAYGEEIENKETMLPVFNYVEPEEIVSDSPEARLAPTQHLGPSSSRRVKRLKRDSYPSCCSLCNDSIQPEIYEVCQGPYNMAVCTVKLERLGFDGDELCDAVEIFVNDLQRRQAFIKLADPKAFIYVSRLLKKPPPQPGDGPQSSHPPQAYFGWPGRGYYLYPTPPPRPQGSGSHHGGDASPAPDATGSSQHSNNPEDV